MTAVIEAGEPLVLENAEGGRITPSVVASNAKSGETYVGQMAKRQAVTNPQNTIFSVKRLMGRKFEDAEVQRAINVLPYKIVRASNGDAHVQMGSKTYAPPQVSALVLQKLKQDAESKLGEKITQAVITVPAYFNDAQRQATKDAGQIAGLDVMRIINEPTASSLAYGVDKNKSDATVAVFDLGGGTFDISLLQLGDGVFEVKSTNGDTFLGGDDFDNRIIDWMIKEFRQESGIDLGNDQMALQRLRDAAEKAKIELSTVFETEINLPFITADASGPKHMVLNLSRSRMEQLVSDLLDRTVEPCRQAMNDAGLTSGGIDEVVLVGGMDPHARSPGKGEGHLRQGAQPHRQRRRGRGHGGRHAGRRAGGRRTGHPPAGRHSPHPGTGDPGQRLHLPHTQEHHHPHVQERDVHHRRRQPDQRGDPRAPGRAPHGPGQQVHRQVHPGRHTPGGQGSAQVEVTFDIDANGILSVSAKDKGTGKEQKIVIQASSGLNKDEVEQMVQQAQQYAAEDEKKRAEAETRNQAESLVYSAEKLLSEQADKVSAELKQEVEEKITALRTAIQQNDVAQMQAAMNELNAALQKVGQAVYSQPGAETPPGQAEGGPSDEDQPEGTVEGEFREV